jgi:diacylglycerol kinase (ATP)
MTGGADGLPAVVVNGARVRDLARLRGACQRAAAAAGWQPPLLLPTTSDDSGTGQARRAVQAGAALVVVVGGDGTVRACAQTLAGTAVPLAIVPAGLARLLTWLFAAGTGGSTWAAPMGRCSPRWPGSGWMPP